MRIKKSSEELALYNADIKERFLCLYKNPDSRDEYRAILLKVAYFENIHRQDLFSFNYEQLRDTLVGFGCRTIKAMSTVKSVISQYLRWSLKEGYSKNCIDITDLVVRNDIRENVNKIAMQMQYITEEEVYNIAENFCLNKQDAVIFILFFVGAKGKVKYDELRNLKVSDCNFDKLTLLLSREDENGKIVSTRTIQVCQRAMFIIKQAIDEQEYYKNNARIDTGVTAPIYMISPTEYVIRYTGNRKNSSSQVDSQVISKRVEKIARLLERSYLTPTSIFMSGLLNYLKEKEREKGKALTNDDYREAHNRYGLHPDRYYDTKDLYLFLNNKEV